MKSEFVSPEFDIEETKTTYRVRFWSPPPEGSDAWAIDDWKIVDAVSVSEVLTWAEAHESSMHYEIFAQGGQDAPMLRIHGEPADNSEQSINILLVPENDSP